MAAVHRDRVARATAACQCVTVRIKCHQCYVIIIINNNVSYVVQCVVCDKDISIINLERQTVYIQFMFLGYVLI